MKNLNSTIRDLIKNCLDRHYECLTKDTYLVFALSQLCSILNDLIWESRIGIDLLEEIASVEGTIQQEMIDQFNSHGNRITLHISNSYENLWKLKPFLWEYNKKLFDNLLVAIHEKALWVYKCYPDSYHPVHLIPGNIKDISQYASKFIKALLHIEVTQDGKVLLGQRLATKIAKMRKAQEEDKYTDFLSGIPLPMEEAFKYPEIKDYERKKIPEDWQMILDITRHSLPIDLRDKRSFSTFITERTQAVNEIKSSYEIFRDYLSSYFQKNTIKIESGELTFKVTSEIIAHLQSMTHFHLDIKWDKYSELSLSVSGPVVFETGVTISTSKLHEIVANYPNPEKLIDLSIIYDLGKQLFSAIFVGCSLRDNAPDLWEEEKYDGVIIGYRRGREHAESKSKEAIFTINSHINPYYEKYSDLQRIPFELLHDGDDFLCLKYSLYRFPLDISKAPPFYITGNMKHALLIAANPCGCFANIPDVSEEISMIKELLSAKDCKCDVLDQNDATIDNVLRLLEEYSYDIIHIACHSSFDQENPEQSCLIIGNRSSGPQKLTAVSLRKYIRDCHTQLVFLNSCRSGTHGVLGDSYGLVDCIVRGGVPSAIGMQWPINSQRSVEISSEFYSRFIRGDTIESALRKCRRAIGTKNGWSDLSWACPILVQAPR
jgi:hypothetical protein